ncbi:uncharacterized protein LOC144018542 isoform X2 [Festucalex cinctus]
MFPSSGLFARVPCPFSNRYCERPHCWYKHAEKGRRFLGYSLPPYCSLPPVGRTGAQDGIQSTFSAAQVVDYAKDKSLQELESINKKIETAKYEVEQEQRKLSGYRTAKVYPTMATGENANGNLYVHPNGIKAPSQSNKYVLDNSKPRTDLEYDPMSNFTAEFGSYKSSCQLLKEKSVQKSDVKKPISHPVAPYRSPSPGIKDDSYDDGILIIDMQASPDKKSSQSHRDPDTCRRPVQKKARSKDCEESATNVIDLTECVEDLDGKLPNPEVGGFRSSEDETKQDHASDEGNKPVCVETEILSSREDSFSLQAAAADNNGVNVIVISSTSDEDEEEELDMELSDSDPVEECYRIFMEANNQDSAGQEQSEVPMEPKDVAKPNKPPEIPAVKPQELPAKRRIAHESKDTQVAAAKRRPQPQILVPLRAPVTTSSASQHVASVPKTQQVQKKAAILTAALKGGQAFLSSVGQRKHERWPMPATPSLPCLSTPPTAAANSSPAAQQNEYVNYIPPGSTVLNVGDNLRLILPQGTLPLNSTSHEVTSVITPIGQAHLGPAASETVSTSVQRYRSTAPLLIPATPLRRSRSSSAVEFPAAASKTPSQAAIKVPYALVGSKSANAPPNPAATKRKAKQQSEAPKDKVPHDIRQRYVNQFTEVFLDTSANIDEAFKKALAEEKTVYNRSVNKLKYLSVAVNALKRLKKQNSVTSTDENIHGKNPKGNIPLNWKQLKGNDDASLYEILCDYILSEEQLIESNYPVRHPEKPSQAVVFANKKSIHDPLKRICCRCGATYSVNKAGKHTRTEECNYHYGKGVESRVPGGVETRYSCCQGVMGAPGCQTFKLHVHDSLAMDGFVATNPRRPADSSSPGVYALDCEMCYTIHGLELSRVTVVNSSLQVVYDTFVKPHNEVIDYNTRFSGISEEDMEGNDTSLAEVQKTLLSFICADTILIGHGLETDLSALKLFHGTVVDTGVVYPHRLGPPHRLSLSSLTAEHLTRIIQESVCGHDTAEDAAACMELMLLKGKDSKVKK